MSKLSKETIETLELSKETIEALAALAFENNIKKVIQQSILQKMGEVAKIYNIPPNQENDFYDAINLNYNKWLLKFKNNDKNQNKKASGKGNNDESQNVKALDLVMFDKLIK